MYVNHSEKTSCFRKYNEAEYNNYDDDYKGFSNEVNSNDCEFSKEKKNFFDNMFRKLGRKS